MSASTNLVSIPEVVDGSELTSGFFNSRFNALQNNILSVNSGVPGPGALSDSTWAALGLAVSSNSSSYIRFSDPSNQRSTYHIGSFNTGTADGLNIWDESGQTMIVSFSKQSVRFYQNVIAPVVDQAGAVVNGKSFGMRIDGATDDTAVLQDFLNSTSARVVVLIPSTGTCIINSTVTIGPYKTVVNLGVVRRPSSSTHTGPVFQLMGGEYPSLIGQGALNSFIMCENASPEGIVLCGVQDSQDSAGAVSNRFGAVRGLTLVGDSGLTSIGLNFRSTQPYGAGTCYDFQSTDLQIQNVGVGIKQHTLTNANLFANINMFGITNVGVWIAGDSDGSALVSDCAYNTVVLTSSPSLRTVLMVKNCSDTMFEGLVTEPEAGDFLQVDNTNSRLFLSAADNIASFGSWAPGSSIRMHRGVADIGKFSISPTEITPTSIGTMDLGSHQALPWRDLNMTGTVWFHNNAAVRRAAFTSDATNEWIHANNAGTEIIRFGANYLKPATSSGYTFHFNQGRFIGLRVQPSHDSTTLYADEFAASVAAGATPQLALRSGGTVYYFASSSSTVG